MKPRHLDLREFAPGLVTIALAAMLALSTSLGQASDRQGLLIVALLIAAAGIAHIFVADRRQRQYRDWLVSFSDDALLALEWYQQNHRWQAGGGWPDQEAADLTAELTIRADLTEYLAEATELEGFYLDPMAHPFNHAAHRESLGVMICTTHPERARATGDHPALAFKEGGEGHPRDLATAFELYRAFCLRSLDRARELAKMGAGPFNSTMAYQAVHWYYTERPADQAERQREATARTPHYIERRDEIRRAHAAHPLLDEKALTHYAALACQRDPALLVEQLKLSTARICEIAQARRQQLATVLRAWRDRELDALVIAERVMTESHFEEAKRSKPADMADAWAAHRAYEQRLDAIIAKAQEDDKRLRDKPGYSVPAAVAQIYPVWQAAIDALLVEARSAGYPLTPPHLEDVLRR